MIQLNNEIILQEQSKSIELDFDIPEYTKDDFLNKTTPYDFLYEFRNNNFTHDIVKNRITEIALSVGVKGFVTKYNSYKKAIAKVDFTNNTYRLKIDDKMLEFYCGNWNCSNDSGITTITNYGIETICYQPIIPIERLINLDTGNHKLTLAYLIGNEYKSIVVDKSVLAAPSKIIELASKGIPVTSENAKNLIKYLTDIEQLNYDKIPEKHSISRLGYIQNGFLPYVDDIEFDGDGNFRTLYNSVSQKGDFDKWKSVAKKCRNESISAKILLAASFASALIKKCDALPFFVHLWGVDSGTGKTVGLMLAASVWGNPERGQYVQTFNATEVGQERLAAFLNDLPIMIDELQLARDKRGNTTFNVYALAQGTGRTRGNKNGGVDATPTWSNCIITTGESPLANYSDGAGAVNRVIEIECKADQKVVADGVTVSAEIKRNYGFAGREFVETLMENPEMFDMIIAKYREKQNEIQNNDITEKQAMAAALILVADMMAGSWFFNDENPLTFDELKPFLKSQSDVSLGRRGYEFICDWVSQNTNRFRTSEENNGEIYGVIEPDMNDKEWVYINTNKFGSALDAVGISSQSVLSWLKTKRLLQHSAGRNSMAKRINGVSTNCVVIQLPSDIIVQDVEFVTDL